MAGGAMEGPQLDELDGWRVAILFVIFFAVAWAFEACSAALDRWLKRRGKRALLHVVRRLQFELLVLGLISLVLVAFEEYLVKICVTGNDWVLYSEQLEESSCGEGKEPLWSSTAILQAHILVFVIAAVHICYAAISLLLCLWRLQHWRRFEEQAQGMPVQALHSSFLPMPRDSWLIYAAKCCASMAVDRVSLPLYCALRHLFIERLDLPASFDFHAFLTEALEEEFSRVLSVELVFWLLAMLWVLVPPQALMLIWSSALAVLAIVGVGAKLQSVLNQLAAEAHRRYGAPAADKPMFTPAPASGLGAGNTCKAPGNEGKGADAPGPEAGRQHGGRGTCCAASAADDGTAGHGRSEVVQLGAQVRRGASAAGAALDIEAPPDGASSAATALADAAASTAADAASLTGPGSHTPDQPGSSRETASVRSPGFGRSGGFGVARAWQACIKLVARARGALVQRLTRGAREGRDGRSPEQGEEEQGEEEQGGPTSPGPDPAQLFWLGRPHLLLRAVQIVYFENSLAVAIVLFDAWQGLQLGWQPGGWATLGPLIAVLACLLLFTSLVVLPSFALTTAAGTHTVQSVLKRAAKHGIKPDAVAALRHLSAQPRGRDSTAELAAAGAAPAARDQASCAGSMWQRGAAGGGAALAAVAAVAGAPRLARNSAPALGRGVRASSPDGRPGRTRGAERLAAAAQQGGLDLDLLCLPTTEHEDAQRSLTRVVGAMLHKQLMRASPAPNALGTLQLSRPPSLGTLDATSPPTAAAGAGTLPALSPPSSSQTSSDAPPCAHVGDGLERPAEDARAVGTLPQQATAAVATGPAPDVAPARREGRRPSFKQIQTLFADADVGT